MLNPTKPFAMKSVILLLFVSAALFTGCTTAYKTGQTPDDVYYSPARPQEEYVRAEKEEDRRSTYDDAYYDDRYLRMKVRNRYRWNDLNDWYYFERYGFGYNYYFGSFHNPYNSWNYYYNPYSCCCYGQTIYVNPKATAYTPAVKPRSFNLGGYTNTNYNNANTSSSKSRFPLNNSYNNSNNRNSGKGLSESIRTILSRNNDNSGGSGNSGRTYNPSNSSSSSSSGSSGSSGGSKSGGVSRPGRN